MNNLGTSISTYEKERQRNIISLSEPILLVDVIRNQSGSTSSAITRVSEDKLRNPVLQFKRPISQLYPLELPVIGSL
uniref:Uncharacterized protein n=1 Tax=Syphacia muris TaxID=451379 RepID=A0A0N5AFI1_9BILA